MTDKERRLTDALEEIVNPITYLQREADAKGGKLNGHVAYQLSNDPNYLKGIARKALLAEADQ